MVYLDMICEECKKEGKISRVFDEGSSSTLLNFKRYWDENGVYHVHDPNKITTSYRCSNGHTFVIKMLSQCPAKDCNYGRRI